MGRGERGGQVKGEGGGQGNDAWEDWDAHWLNLSSMDFVGRSEFHYFFITIVMRVLVGFSFFYFRIYFKEC